MYYPIIFMGYHVYNPNPNPIVGHAHVYPHVQPVDEDSHAEWILNKYKLAFQNFSIVYRPANSILSHYEAIN